MKPQMKPVKATEATDEGELLIAAGGERLFSSKTHIIHTKVLHIILCCTAAGSSKGTQSMAVGVITAELPLLCQHVTLTCGLLGRYTAVQTEVLNIFLSSFHYYSQMIFFFAQISPKLIYRGFGRLSSNSIIREQIQSTVIMHTVCVSLIDTKTKGLDFNAVFINRFLSGDHQITIKSS
jgi:hypothetical protein